MFNEQINITTMAIQCINLKKKKLVEQTFSFPLINAAYFLGFAAIW